MPRYVALLRGVNVGKAKRIAMAEFRPLLGGLGYENVTTLLNSGNAVFDAPKGSASAHATAIASAITERLSFEAPVIVKSAKEFAAIVAENPIATDESEHSRFLVAFVQDPKSLAGLSKVEPLVVPPERFAIGENAAYLWCASGILESKAGEGLLAKVGSAVTTRNWATVLKLAALLSFLLVSFGNAIVAT